MTIASAPGRPHTETYNTLTHLLGLVLSVPAAIALVVVSGMHGDFWRTVGCVLFGGCLIAVYAMSMLSHHCATSDLRSFFRALDQGCIYLLIVATYTPFSLAFLRTPGWSIYLACLWSIALAGFCSKVFFAHRLEGVTIWIYVLLGWLPGVAAPALIPVVPVAALWWMLIGGLWYTSGVYFLVNDHRARWFHPLWHLFVIAGSASHYYAILKYIAAA